MLLTSELHNRNARLRGAAHALGPAERIEVALAHVVNSTRRATRNPSSLAMAQLVEHVSDFIHDRACEVPDAWLHACASYRRIELWRDAQLGCQILAMVLPPGARTPIHDHGGAWGIEAVWSGELQVTEFEISESTRTAVRLRPSRDRKYGAGELLSFMPPADVHLCRNSSRLCTTVSIHVYANTQTRMTTFEAQEDGWHTLAQRNLHTEPR